MFDSMLSFSGGLFGELDRLRRELDDTFGSAMPTASIRSAAPGSFPALNLGNSPSSLEVYAFAPGLDASKIELTVDRGVLTIKGERASPLPAEAEARQRKLLVHKQERPCGSFVRTIALPDDVDPAHVNASYRDGVLQISIARRESAQPRRIEIQ